MDLSQVVHHFTVFCDKVLVDYTDTNKYSFIGVFTNIVCPTLPAKIVGGFAVVCFSGGDKSQVSLVIEDAKGNLIHDAARHSTGSMAPSTPKKIQVGMLIQQLTNLEFEREGTYYLVLKHGDEPVSRVPFGVISAKEALNVPTAKARRPSK